MRRLPFVLLACVLLPLACGEDAGETLTAGVTFTGSGDATGTSGDAGESGGGESQGDGDTNGDGDGTTGDGTTGDGTTGDGTTGDGTTGDGDGTTGDGTTGDGTTGDGTTGDGTTGDGTTGDGDGTTGDGDGTTGDGDGTTGDGDGTTGDGDGTTGDGDGTTGDGTTGDGTTGDGDGTTTGDGDGTTAGDGDGDGDGTTGDPCLGTPNQCFSDGQTRCANLNIIETCIPDGLGCFHWANADCTSVQPFGQCDDSGPAALCQACVTEPCTPGETRCTLNTHESCLAGAGGCGDWQQATDCSAVPGGSGFCDASASPPICVNNCAGATNLCPTFGAQRCSTSNSALIQVCDIDASQNSCLAWTDEADCTGTTPPGINDALAVCIEDSPAYSCERPMGCLTEQPSVTYEPPRIVLTLDRSGSMFYASSFYDHDNNAATPNVSRWNGLHVAVTNILSQYQGQIEFGVEQFPTSTSSSCTVSAPVDVPVALNNMPAILSTIPTATASEDGGTPGQPAVTNTLNYLTGLAGTAPKAQIYFSDGAVGCSSNTSTMQTQMANAFAAGIPTYVVGINANAAGLQTELNGFANAGGVPQPGSPQFFDGQDTAALQAAMDQIIGGVVTCDIDLSVPPPEPDNIDVQVNGMQYTRLDSTLPGFKCTGTDGWFYTNEPGCSGMPFTCLQISLCGQACTDFKALTPPTATVEYFCTSG